MFRGVKEKIKELDRRAEEAQKALVVALCSRLRSFNIDATVDESWKIPYLGWWEKGRISGAVRIANRNIDLVELECAQEYGYDGDYYGDTYRCNYVVCKQVEGLEYKLKARLKPVKKGLLSKEIDDLNWEGKETDLAKSLNEDFALYAALYALLNVGEKHAARQDSALLPLEIKPFKKQQCVRIRPKRSSQPTTSVFPTFDAFEAYDRIAWHVRAVAHLHGGYPTK